MKWRKVKQMDQAKLDNILTKFQKNLEPLRKQLEDEIERLTKTIQDAKGAE